MEQGGALVPRPREYLETSIDRFQVTERDGTVISCAALFCFPEEKIGGTRLRRRAPGLSRPRPWRPTARAHGGIGA